MHDGWMFGMGWFWILALILVAVGIWAALRGGTRSEPGSGDGTRRQSPEEMLRERLARGEIDEDEFRSRMKTLNERG